LFILSKLSLANRAVVALITVIIAAFGFLSLGSLKQELIPSIEIPSAAIVTSYAGASPEVVDEQVSVPIENAVLGLENMESTTVTSTTGLSVIRVSFEYGTTTAQATERLNNAISKVQGSLPQDAEPQVLSGSFDSVPIIVLAVAANDGDNEAIGRELEQSAPSIFQQVDGVRDVAVSGAVSKQINLTLNQPRLASAGLTQRDIATALTANGLVLPVGTLTDENGSIAIQMGSAVNTVEAIKDLPLIGASSSRVVTIGDVADVVYEDSPVTSIARTNGKESLAVSITKTPDANTVAVSNSIEKLVPELEAALGGDVTIVTTLDQAPFIEKSIKDLTTEGLLGLTFAVIIILIFLFSVKSTLITAISIPTSVLITFIGLQTADYSLNILTLGALTIAIGRVVDDSIVVIENINRHLSYGEKRKKAVLTAVKEVSGAITASTITTVAVFLPIALVGGLIGELFRPFAFTVAISLLASLLVSLTIVPVLAYWFLRMPKRLVALKEADPKRFEKKQRHAEEEREKKSFLQRGYLPALNGTRRHPWLTLFASVLILGFTFSLVPQLKTNFIDGAGSTQFIARLSMPASTTFEDQDKAANELEQKIMDVEGVKVVQSTVGSAADGRVAFGAAASGISITVQVDEKVDVEVVKAEILKLEVPADADLTVASGAGFGSSETIDIEVASSDNELLQEAVDILTAEMETVPNTSGVTSTLDADERVLEVIVDREKAAALGFTETQVTGIVASQLRPSPLGRVSVEGEDVSVYVSGANVPESIAEIKALVIPSFTGLVRLDSIASVEEVLKPTSITSKEGNRTAKVSIAPEGDDLGAITLDITTKLDAIELPAGVTATIGGAAADQAESFQQLGLALLAAIAIVYVVMVATFGSLIQPLLLLVSIPFAATGALGLLLLTDTPLGVPALIGMLMLIGIVVTNAIVLIDLVNQYRKEGRSVEDSLVSGARQRLRPILMTALATIFALTPMAMGLTGNSGFISQPLAIVVIGGLFSSTLLTLILVPTLYWLVEGRKERKALRIARREAKAAKKAEKKQAKADAKVAVAAPVAVATESAKPEPVVAEAPQVVEAPEVIEEMTEDALADAIADTFTPAQPAETPNLSWSITQDEVELDSEATMQWSESKTDTAPIAAIQPEESLDFLTSENPIVAEPSAKDLKAQRKAEKAELKAQKKAAKNSRHSGD
jgi:HAE1 family hydrophobic/amphiphilic exporter-1